MPTWALPVPGRVPLFITHGDVAGALVVSGVVLDTLGNKDMGRKELEDAGRDLDQQNKPHHSLIQ